MVLAVFLFLCLILGVLTDEQVITGKNPIVACKIDVCRPKKV